MVQKGAFTSEQQEILGALGKTTLTYVHTLHQLLSEAYTLMAALHLVLGRKGVIDIEELEAAKKEIEAAHAVEMALSPEVQALEDEFNRLIRDAGLQNPSGEGG